MSDPKNSRLSHDDIATALQNAGGIIAVAAQQLKCHRNTIRNRINKSKKLQDKHDEIREDLLDLAEGKLIEKINAGDNTAIIFFLKTQGKRRGYTERSEVTGAEGKDLPAGGVIAIPAAPATQEEYLEQLRAQQRALEAFASERQAKG